MGLEFVDLTLEPPSAATWKVNGRFIKAAIERYGMKVVGHTAYYLPISSPFESLRKAAVEELKRSLEVFSILGVAWMNIHPGCHAPMHERNFIIDRNLQSLQELLTVARDCGIGLMLENIPGDFNNVAQLSELLDPLPQLGLHLDIGHSNLLTKSNTADEFISVYGHRLRHVHLHDNKGGAADLHLPLGTGVVDVVHYVKSLRTSGYDSTITLEVFSSDSKYLAYSRDFLRKVWDDCIVFKPEVVKGSIPKNE
jgi:sugar phosphate isomerase/epimerase